ncbi:uncharacterized protein HKW66_Vig0222880 [Vigna angularis]|uniref:HAT C-terminal dimerisation domain-containing protein n=2 Tax=Phaseolus angularis TaxID=3914 RepID=A0A8T0JZK6_PHAAN|nr:uncharacterized protein LOC108337575 [Vigna angularis]KAG2390306.1 uncharacterized protein HKW66_Vig0222880 [Vigna angularis]BAT82590.1 hypothetical protein VIGAN_03263000 [Vigna angularis var. angularis]
MFTSKQWKSSFFSRTTGGKLVQSLVMDDKFWKSVVVCLLGASPLIKVLHLVSLDQKPVIGFIYDEMKRVKEKIQHAFKFVKKRYMPLWDIIDERWDEETLRPLHATVYYLNPRFHYDPSFEEDFDVKLGLYGSLSKMIAKQDWSKVDHMLEDFKHARNSLGNEITKIAIKTKNPADWWDSYGSELPELQHFAKRILSLTTNSFGCVDNRNAFDTVHMKRRNRLRQQILKDVLLVMTNSKLTKRHQAEKSIEYSIDDLSSDDEWITESNESVSNNEEPELDDLCLFIPIEDDEADSKNDNGAYVDDLQIHDDDDIELDEAADVDDEDGESYSTDDVTDRGVFLKSPAYVLS